MRTSSSEIPLSYAALFRLGENVELALDEGDLEAIAELLLERQEMIDRLLSTRNPASVGADWREWATALTDQDERLQRASHELEERLRRELDSLERFGEANRSYAATAQAPSVLNPQLRG